MLFRFNEPDFWSDRQILDPYQLKEGSQIKSKDYEPKNPHPHSGHHILHPSCLAASITVVRPSIRRERRNWSQKVVNLGQLLFNCYLNFLCSLISCDFPQMNFHGPQYLDQVIGVKIFWSCRSGDWRCIWREGSQKSRAGKLQPSNSCSFSSLFRGNLNPIAIEASSLRRIPPTSNTMSWSLSLSCTAHYSSSYSDPRLSVGKSEWLSELRVGEKSWGKARHTHVILSMTTIFGCWSLTKFWDRSLCSRYTARRGWVWRIC